MERSLIFRSSGFITAPYGDYWKFMKELMVTKFLGPQALERLRGVRADEVARFHSNMLDKAMNKKSVNIREEVMKLINNSICKILMGRSCSEDVERVRGLVTETDALSKKRLLASLLRRPLEKLRIPLFKKEIMGVSCRYDELLERILLEHEEKLKEQGMDLMDVLLEAYGDENAEYKITRNHIKSLFFNQVDSPLVVLTK
ncbi:unnamed protein product [Arabis nemorensis]|uniref:Cytochrome P450 n=1 Tax=Arabis nemorensis TaxID=586526 RepID=A0A565B754_9BRAS|nr:unnamed protein product [Arabis nemorensis]